MRQTQAIFNSKCDAPETSVVEAYCVTEEEQVDSEKHNLSASLLPQSAFVYALLLTVSQARLFPSLQPEMKRWTTQSGDTSIKDLETN